MRHATHRWAAQVLWLAAGPVVVSGGFAVRGWSQWAMFLLGLLVTSVAPRAIRWASTSQTGPGPGWRAYKTLQALTPRWQFDQRLLLLVAKWIFMAISSMTGAARVQVYRLATWAVGGHRQIMASVVAPPVAGAVTGLLAYTVAALWFAVTGLALPSSLPWVIGMAVALGWLAGLFCDALTKTGATLVYPFSRRRFSLLPLETSPEKWARGDDGKIPDRPTPVALGEAIFNGLLALTAFWLAVTILAVA